MPEIKPTEITPSEKENIPHKKDKRLALLVWITIGLFVLLEFVLGNGVRPNGIDLMNNARCFKYLGCNIGFFGYDALVHFTFGIFEAPFIIWLFEKYYHISLFHNGGKYDFWKNMFILIATLVLVGYAWEMIELLSDEYRIRILHEVLFVHGSFNNLLQPTNNDTMGDIFFSTIGGVIGGFIAQFIGAEIF